MSMDPELGNPLRKFLMTLVLVLAEAALYAGLVTTLSSNTQRLSFLLAARPTPRPPPPPKKKRKKEKVDDSTSWLQSHGQNKPYHVSRSSKQKKKLLFPKKASTQSGGCPFTCGSGNQEFMEKHPVLSKTSMSMIVGFASGSSTTLLLLQIVDNVFIHS